MEFKSKFVEEVEECLKNNKFEAALHLVADNKHEKDLNISCADLINAIACYLTDENFKEKPELFGASERILKEIAAKANKEDVLFELLELLEGVQSDELLISLLKSLQVVLLRTNHKNSQAIGWGLDAIGGYIDRIAMTSELVAQIGPEEESLLENEPVVHRLLSLYLIIFKFIEPVQDSLLATKFKQHEFRLSCFNSQNVLATFLLQLLGGTFAYLGLGNGDIKTCSRQCAEKILQFFFKSFKNPFTLLEYVEERVNYPVKDPNQGSSNIFLQPERIDLLPLAMLFYLMYAENIKPVDLPTVYRPQYLIDQMLRLVVVLFKREEANLQYKGIQLGLSLLKQFNVALTVNDVDSQTRETFFDRLASILCFSTVERNRKHGSELYSLALKKHTPESQHQVIVHLFNTVENPGIRGFVITIYKDLIARDLPNINRNFENTILEHIFVLEKGEETHLMDNKDTILAALNFLIFLVIRDPSNDSGVWDFFNLLQGQFLEPLRRALELSRAHYHKEHKRVFDEPEVVKNEAPMVDLNVMNAVPGEEALPAEHTLSKDQKLSIISYSLNTFDIMDSVLARINEYSASRKVE